MHLKVKNPNEHPLKEILERAVGLSGMELRQELRWHGHNVYPAELDFMLRGIEPMPPDLEAALRRIAAEHLEQCTLPQEEADRLIEGWLHGDEDKPSPDL